MGKTITEQDAKHLQDRILNDLNDAKRLVDKLERQDFEQNTDGLTTEHIKKNLRNTIFFDLEDAERTASEMVRIMTSQDTRISQDKLKEELIRFIIIDLKRETPKYIAYILELVRAIAELSDETWDY